MRSLKVVIDRFTTLIWLLPQPRVQPSSPLQDFVDSIFNLMALPLCCPNYSLVSKRAKRDNISIKKPTQGEISYLVIDATGLKVFGEGVWKVRQHSADRGRV